MQNKLQAINEQEVLGKHFRVYGNFENPLMLAKDVAEWIEYSKTSEGYYNVSAMLSTVDEDEKVTIKIINSDGKPHKHWFLTEDGLYEVLMQSRKPIAKQFKKKVKKILKDIRKYGMYAKDDLLNNPDFLLEVAGKLKEEKDGRLLAEAKVATLEDNIEALEAEVKESAPKLKYYDVILQSPSAVLATIIAKDYGMSAIELNKCLHRLGVQFKFRNTWVLYAEHQGNGYTVSKTYKSGNGNSYISTCWTQKGRLWLYELLKSNGVLPEAEKVA